MIEARVRKTGRYVGGTDSIEIHVDRRSAVGLPFVDGRRVAIALRVGDERVTAGLRATPDCGVVWISPDVYREDGTRSTLAELLGRLGFAPNDAISLAVDGHDVRITRVER